MEANTESRFGPGTSPKMTTVATRVWLHRFGSLSDPSQSSILSSAAALTGADGITWKHLFVDPENGVLGLAVAPDGQLAECSGPPVAATSTSAGSSGNHRFNNPRTTSGGKPCTNGFAFNRFIAAGVNQLEQSLKALGRSLDIVNCGHESTDAVDSIISYARRAGATEVHSVVSRDPWTAEADFKLRTAAQQHGVSVSVQP